MTLSFADYLAIDAVNWSTLIAMGRSPLHYRHRCDHGRPDSAPLALGRAAHAAILEPERFVDEFVCYPGNRRAGKTWNAFKASHPGKEILKLSELERALGMRAAVLAHPEAMRYLAEGVAEEVVTWTDPKTRLDCKGRIDWISKSSPARVDIKSATSIEMPVFARAVLRYGAHAQSAFYGDGWATRYGEELPGVIVAVESTEPYDVGVFRLDDETNALGQDEYQRLLKLVAVHRGLGTWPGRYPLEMRLELPRWAFGDDDDTSDLGLTGFKEPTTTDGGDADPADLF